MSTYPHNHLFLRDQDVRWDQRKAVGEFDVLGKLIVEDEPAFNEVTEPVMQEAQDSWGVGGFGKGAGKGVGIGLLRARITGKLKALAPSPVKTTNTSRREVAQRVFADPWIVQIKNVRMGVEAARGWDLAS